METRGTSFATAGRGVGRASNRFALDYREEAKALGRPACPIIDFHTHVNGPRAALVWLDAAQAFGIDRVLTMVRRADAPVVRAALGRRVGFIAFPDFRQADRGHAMREGFLDDIRAFQGEHGARMIKLWNAPRLREYFPDATGLDLVEFDGHWRVRQVELAERLGMSVMVHVADPDTWFQSRYADASKYGRKRDHYRGLEAMLERFRGVKWFAAHMAGMPEDLDFLDAMLERHPNLHIDTSATKWIVRELGRHPVARVRAFLTRWSGRVIFGSDIVTTDEHLVPTNGGAASPMGELADSQESAFDLYASRYFALRTMFERSHEGESPIADPDLAMVDPSRHGPLDAPTLRGFELPRDMLTTLYRDAALATGLFD
jgi:hypothetical protein